MQCGSWTAARSSSPGPIIASCGNDLDRRPSVGAHPHRRRRDRRARLCAGAWPADGSTATWRGALAASPESGTGLIYRRARRRDSRNEI
jgi:hypothetical protein